MGNNQSSTLTQIAKVINQNVVDIIQQTSANVSTITTASNKITFENKGSIIACSQDMNQTISQTATTKAITEFKDSATLKNMMSTAFQATLDSTSKAINDFLASTFSNQDTHISTKSDLENLFQTKLQNMDVSNITNKANTLNEGIYINTGYIDCKGLPVKMNQTIIQQQFADDVTNSMLDAFSDNSELLNVIQNLDNQLESKNTGVGDALSKILSSVGLFVLLPILVIVLIVGGIYLLFKMGGKKNTNLANVVNSGIKTIGTAAQ